MSVQVFEPAYNYIDGRLTEFLNERLGDVIAQVQGPLAAALALYVVLYGWAVIRGSIDEPIIDGAIRLVKLMFIYVVATSVGYSEYVTEPLFVGLPNILTTAISGSDGATVGSAFDSFLNSGFDVAQRNLDEASPINIFPYVVALLVFACTIAAAAIGFGITLLAKVALALLVALGPIFIACLVFEASRRFFYGWLSQAINYILLFVLIIAIFELILSLSASLSSSVSADPDPIVAGILFSALCILGVIFFAQTPAIAAGIAGGASLGIKDFSIQTSKAQSPQAGSSGGGSGGGGGGSIRSSTGSSSPSRSSAGRAVGGGAGSGPRR